jgi:hypothetical protein
VDIFRPVSSLLILLLADFFPKRSGSYFLWLLSTEEDQELENHLIHVYFIIQNKLNLCIFVRMLSGKPSPSPPRRDQIGLEVFIQCFN